MLPGVERRGSSSRYLEPGDFFAHLQSFAQLHLPPLSHPHELSPQALHFMSFLLAAMTPPVLHHANPGPGRHAGLLALTQPACSRCRRQWQSCASPARQRSDRAIASGDTG